MKPLGGLLSLALLTSLVAALTAQDRLPDAKDKKDQIDTSKDVVARVAKDMRSAEERLKKNDPGDLTRKIQRDVVDGLDEMIKQTSKSQGGGGKKSVTKKSATGSKDSDNPQDGMKEEMMPGQDQQLGSSSQKKSPQDSPGKAKGGKDEGPHAKDKSKGEGQEEKEGEGKDGGKETDKDGPKGVAKNMGPGKEQGQQTGLGNIKSDKSSTASAGDPYRLDWGHLPKTKRMEMDAYSKERFMPRYDEILQQYYRTIAEQGQRKDD